MDTANNTIRERLRSLPSVDEALRSPVAAELSKRFGRKQLTEMVRRAITETRASIVAGADINSEMAVADALSRSAEQANERPLNRVINATGVLIHTNLGRAPLSDAAKDAIIAAAGPCTLEYDLATGTRGRRAPLAEKMVCDLTGAEAALVVNNCASAAFFVLKAFASGGEVIVSRGELVEIGGDFRVPDILAESGSEMLEVGTTNRTRLTDYAKAINETTKVILRVHPSNYRIVGFTERPSLSELSALAKERNVILYEDLGSGALIDNELAEPTVGASITAGVDIVTFSGDKLLGGPQCGIIVGKADLIDKLRKHPLYRALRVDKLTSAALEATLRSYVAEHATEEVPVQRMLAASAEEITKRASGLLERVRDRLLAIGFTVGQIDGLSAVGGGAAPEVELATSLIAITHSEHSPDSIAEKLRRADPPVIARIEDDRVLLDLRTVTLREEKELEAALRSVAEARTE